MSDFKFMKDDLTDRICAFGSKHFGVTIDIDGANGSFTTEHIALDDKLFAAATRLFWDHYFDSEVEL